MAPYTHPDFAALEDFMADSKNGYDRPVANNTRLTWRGADSLAYRLHNTDVVTIHRDGSRTLATNGWTTVTTKDRIHQFGSRYVSGNNERGEWFVRAEDDPKDPFPLAQGYGRAQRSIAKPFHVSNPGPEPVKGTEGCIAGRREDYSYRTTHLMAYGAPHGAHVLNGKYSVRYIGAANGTIVWGEPSSRYPGVPGEDYKQCPHCLAFDQLHARWDVAFNGTRWGRGSNQGYRQMVEALERFGDVAGWKAAYLADSRSTRAKNVEVKAWCRRNLIPFYDGITVTPQGLAPLKAKREHCKVVAQEIRLERERARNHVKRVAFEKKMQKRAAHRKAVRLLIANAVAESMSVEIQIKRGQCFV